ncbi:amidase signature enzyme [Thozetella sp. PMI_491]|nr:amidase signature enzyme [Thozetella sp. PMI_491]
MPSFNRLVKASISLGSLKSGLPDSISITDSNGVQLLGYFSGWTSQLSVQTSDCHQLPEATFITPLTVFSPPEGLVTCDWVQQEVQAYFTEDDVLEDSFLQAIYLQGASSFSEDLLSCLGAKYGTELLLGGQATGQTFAATAFNPRGDGYQDTGVSSAGAGAATAAYDWVDVSICTDTGGSIRIPASKAGVFALRPSFGALSNEGVMLEGEYFDAVGYHTRSPYTLQSFGKTWLADSNLTTNYTKYPKKIIVPSNLFPVSNKASQAVYADWIAKLATHLNATIETKSIGDYWNETANKPGTEFFSYMQMVAFHLNWKNQVNKVINPFKDDYAAANDGRTPFFNPFPAARYKTAENTTEEDISTSYERLMFFRQWFGENVVKADADACSDSLFMIPMFAGDVSYRNTVYSPPDVGTWASFLMYYYSTQSAGPETVFPIGQVSYQSNVTNHEEKLPVSLDVLAHRGCDLMLLDLTKDLADAGLLKEVKTGSTLW